MKNILFDCDPGHDDALALFEAIAHPNELNILGVTTVGGNQTLENVTKNAKHILSATHSNIELASGQSQPLVKEFYPATNAHGDSGMDGPKFSSQDDTYPLSSQNAVTFLHKKIQLSSELVTIVATGPLTNIALLLKTFPEVKDSIEKIVIMGGGLDHGNMTKAAEFNIWTDPEAAKIVFTSGVEMVMAGLDVTERAYVTYDEIQTFKEQGKISDIVYELLSFYYESGKQFGFKNSPIHDLCTITYLLFPEAFSGETYSVDVVTDDSEARGMTIADKRLLPENKNSTYVLLDVDRKKYRDILMDSIQRLDNR
ncbi:nucleoside hydrolase [Levilactobacillus acidifarinae]|uniref:Ribonucleoside hydrolase RihC n=1 Tax=Levilactobacillus acidifarinae DSM 19394 = JCM 15949 TaxID=1423715 RepID=A0A0R1LHZ0_9LACO|nr:nucleoside hydrolase [Levilactobacillus acidifarinae]KRK95349.1 ribonucleoside hydrolase RihC [Levilactobacillus acidifarinae DSM 19394]GEO70059.1 pyrimidine-specific ribonucleoside hydrolase RihA [Levilactobacillus acidifarinae]